MRAWRVLFHTYARSSMTGNSAATFGGRWNRAGDHVVYCSSNKPLALAGLVQNFNVPGLLLDRWVAIPVDIPLDIGISSLSPDDLPPTWREFPGPAELAELGHAWLEAHETCVLEVPSRIILGDTHLLLNPQHPAFGRIQSGPPEPLPPTINALSVNYFVGGTITKQRRGVFICHASEDKRRVVDPIVNELDAVGIPYWYDKAALRVGDSITGGIQEGLRESDYALVVLSERFLSKRWATLELEAALSVEVSRGRTFVIPLIIGSAQARERILHALPLLAHKVHIRWNGSPKAIAAALHERLA
jgi:RES domain-containing protein